MSTQSWGRKEPPTLGEVVRSAREAAGISLRELSRRCGVSAGQLSRIESGAVGQPEMETIEALARAFGVPADPLLVLAGYRGEHDLKRYVHDLSEHFSGWAEELQLAVEGELGSLESNRSLGAADTAAMIVEQWSRRALTRAVGIDDGFSKELEEIAAVWPGLSDDRRRLVLALVADQEVLSRLERMPNPPGRYLASIELKPVASDA